MVRNSLLLALVLGLCLLTVPAQEPPLTIGLRWNPVDEATSYRVHYGTEPGVYTMVNNSSNAKEVLINLECVRYYIAVTAVDENRESPYSREVSGYPFTAPNVPCGDDPLAAPSGLVIDSTVVD